MTTPPAPQPSAPASAAAPPSLDHRSLTEILGLRPGARMGPLIAFAKGLAGETGRDPALVRPTVQALLDLLEDHAGNSRQRMEMGEALGLLGDPRLRRPSDADYWVPATLEDGTSLSVGRHMVTAAEFRAWVEGGGYERREAWTEAGLRWLDSGADRWNALADDPEVAQLVVPNQPAAGVTFWEAQAYARDNGARLLASHERRWLVRGAEKKPYPWGAPFGDGNANTREEGLHRPAAVGIFYADVASSGITDLAGNMGEWLSDEMEDGRRMLHPGSWARPSMAAWAKALELASPDTRSADLSFRIVRGA